MPEPAPARATAPEPTSREDWDLDPAILHLNHGSFGAVPRVVTAEQQRWRREAEANPSAFFSRRLGGLVDAARLRAAGFVGADPRRFLFAPNLTGAIATVLASVHLRPGDEVLLTDDTYPGVRAAVEQACAGVSARMVSVALDPGDLGATAVAGALRDAVTDRTRVAVVDHITSSTAIECDLREIVPALRARGIVVVVDGAHAPGAVPLDVASLGADFYAGNFHKWCCAPRGSAFLAIASDRVAELAPGVAGALTGDGFPGGFEWWGTADYTAWLATPAAFRFLAERGVEEVRIRNRDLVAAGARIVADALGAEAPASSLPMRSIPLPDGVATTPPRARHLQAAIGEELRAEVAVTCSRGRGFLRLSAHLYNRADDYARLAEALPAFLRGQAAEA